jgi:hypothetical protein
MLDPVEPSAEVLIKRARAAEEAALAVTGATNSEGAEAVWGRSEVTDDLGREPIAGVAGVSGCRHLIRLSTPMC